MNSKIILESIDNVLNRLDSMSDEELQAKYENHKHGPVGRVFIEIEHNIETHGKLIGKFKIVPVINKDVYMLPKNRNYIYNGLYSFQKFGHE